jgi:GT2 family glycosyltransferase
LISAVIPTFRGRARLEGHLPSVIEALQRSGRFEVVVVDDGGGGLGALGDEVRVVELPQNRGYGPAVNAGVRAARGELVLILNDDVRLDPGMLTTLREWLDDGVFAVVPRIHSRLARCGDEGGKRGEVVGGLIQIEEVARESTGPTLYPVGCCFLCRREVFLELGGYDSLYAPYFWEDVDLGYRAWRRGLSTLHVPEACCWHDGSATLETVTTEVTRQSVFFRNQVLFQLRNFQEPELRWGLLGGLAAESLYSSSPPRRRGLAEALRLFNRVGFRRLEGLSDSEILARAR